MIMELLKNTSVTTLLLVEHVIYYNVIKMLYHERMTDKQKSYILSVKSSFILSMLGMYLTIFKYFVSSETIEIVSKFTVNIFTAYLITDLYYAITDYKIITSILQCHIHHSVYIFVNIFSLYTGYYIYYVNYMILEIPTFILSFGVMFPSYRNDTLFGITFFILRIVYHIYLTFLYRNIEHMLFLSNLACLLHTYWFLTWTRKYGHLLYPYYSLILNMVKSVVSTIKQKEHIQNELQMLDKDNECSDTGNECSDTGNECSDTGNESSDELSDRDEDYLNKKLK